MELNLDKINIQIILELQFPSRALHFECQGSFKLRYSTVEKAFPT